MLSSSLSLQSPTIQQFLYSLKSKRTQETYLINLDYFEKWYNRKIEDLLKLDSKVIEQALIQYIISMRDKGLSYGYLTARVAPILSYLELNDITINRKKLRKFFGEAIKTVKDEAYTREEIQKMFQFAKSRGRLIIAIYASTGIRKGALVDLRIKHLTKTKDDNFSLYKFTIYENTKEEYITFCTPECANMIDDYIEQRKKAGEKITDESFLIRNDFYNLSTIQARTPKQINLGSLSLLMDRLLVQAGLKTVNHRTETYKYQRQNKSLFHAFRKYFNTCLANCDVNVTIKEMLMGHSVGLDDSYYRPNEKQLLTEYLKAINELTIHEENRLRRKVDILEAKNNEIANMKQEMNLVKQSMLDFQELLKHPEQLLKLASNQVTE
jgi:integrase